MLCSSFLGKDSDKIALQNLTLESAKDWLNEIQLLLSKVACNFDKISHLLSKKMDDGNG